MHFVKKTVLGFLVALLCGAAWCGVVANGHAGARRVNHLTRVSSHGRIAVKAEGNRFSESAKVSLSRTRADGVKRRIMEGLAKKRRGGPRLLGAAKEPSSRKEPSVLAMYDISIESDGAKWQPAANEPVRVTVELDQPVTVKSGSSLGVVHLSDDGAVEELDSSRYGFVYDATKTAVTAFWFDATGFSVYAITGDASNVGPNSGNTPARRLYDFYSRDFNQFLEDGTTPNPTYNTYVPRYFTTIEGNKTFRQIVLNNEYLVRPEALPSPLGRTFLGWFLYDPEKANTAGYDEHGYALERYDFTKPVVFDEGETGEHTYVLRALFSREGYVVFHEQFVNGVWPITAVRRCTMEEREEWENPEDENTAVINMHGSVRIDDVIVTYDDSNDENSDHSNATPKMIFRGWSQVPVTPGALTNINGVAIADTLESSPFNFYRRKDTAATPRHLYPVFVNINWLSFQAAAVGEGATYIPPRYYYQDQGTNRFPVTKRTGYKFDGWYTTSNDVVQTGFKVANADGSLVVPNANLPTTATAAAAEGAWGGYIVNGRLQLVKNVTLYGRWTPDTTRYIVAVWKQTATDEANIAAANRTYDFSESFVVSNVLTESTQSLPSTYRQFAGKAAGAGVNKEDYIGFNYARCTPENGITVKGDGSSVINVYYDRNVHTLTFRVRSGSGYYSSYTTVTSITALVGASIREAFPIKGTNGTVYEGYHWAISQNANTYLMALDTMVERYDTLFGAYDGETATLYYYTEVRDDEAYATELNGKKYAEYKVIKWWDGRSNMHLTEDEEFHEIDGYVKAYADPAFSNGNANIGTGNVNKLYYDRDTYAVTFADSFTKDMLKEVPVKFRDDIAQHVPADPASTREGYYFTGWYIDEACSTKVFFDKAEYDAATDMTNRVLFTEMPSHNLRFFAGWETEWYLIQIDPNGGMMADDQSLWFWEAYDGDPIEEYTTVSRPYVEALDGQYFYAKQDRKYYGYGDNYIRGEASSRRAYYTKNQNDDAIVDTNVRYAPAINAFRYAGWYEVTVDSNGVTNESLYAFGQPVKKNTYLRLHWKQIGTYHVKYMPGDGKIDSRDENESTLEDLDVALYADNSEIIVTRTCAPPTGYSFSGWRIRQGGDRVYRPGEIFNFNSAYVEKIPDANGKPVPTLILDAVYEQVSTTKLTMDANGGTLDPDVAQTIMLAYPDAPSLITNVAEDVTWRSVSGMRNNAFGVLSYGRGYHCTTEDGDELTLRGWNTKADGTGDFFSLGAFVGLDQVGTVNGENFLYAMWGVDVYFDKNNESARWCREGESWGDIYVLTNHNDRQMYMQTNAVLHGYATYPSVVPVSDIEDQMFRCWSTNQYVKGRTLDGNQDLSQYAYDFTTPLKGNLTLYALWSKFIHVPFHVIDTSARTEAEKFWDDNSAIVPFGPEFKIGNSTSIDLTSAPVDTEGRVYVTPPETHQFAFACLAESAESVSESRKIRRVYFNSQQDIRAVYVEYDEKDADGNYRTGPIESGQQIYVVYFTNPRTLPIGYRFLDNSYGSLQTPNNISADAPREARDVGTALDGRIYNMALEEEHPKDYVTGHKYYAFAIGELNATSTAQLHFITPTSSSDDADKHPHLWIRNSWQGYQFCTEEPNDDSHWYTYGFEAQLYVIYFDEEATIVTFSELTKGLESDITNKYEYVVSVTQMTYSVTLQRTMEVTGGRTSSNNGRNIAVPVGNTTYYFSATNWTQTGSVSTVSGGGEPVYEVITNRTVYLSSGGSEALTLFAHVQNQDWYNNGSVWVYSGNGSRNSPATLRQVQRMSVETNLQTVVITQRPKAGFTTTNDTGDGKYVYTATAETVPATHEVTFTNTRTEMPIQLHIALGAGGALLNRDADLRTSDESKYTFSVTNGTDNALVLGDVSDVFIGDTRYVLVGVVRGVTNELGQVLLADTTMVESVTFAQMGQNQYLALYLNGDASMPLGDNDIYLVYAEVPKVYYMKEGANGVLMMINPIEYDGAPIKNVVQSGDALDERTVTQGETLDLDCGETATIATTGRDVFWVPTMIDGAAVGTLTRVGYAFGTQGMHALSEMAGYTADAASVGLKMENGNVWWSADGEAWTAYGEAPAVYVVYKERGWDLTIEKASLASEADKAADSFTLTIESANFKDGQQYLTVGYSEDGVVSPVDGKLTLTMTNGCRFTILSLPDNDITYKLRETPGAGYSLTNITVDANPALPEALRYADDDKTKLVGIDTFMFRNKTITFTNIKYYTVTFVNEDGTVISTATYPYGTTPDAFTSGVEDPTKPMDATSIYRFDEWGPTFEPVGSNTTYTAEYKEIKIPSATQRTDDATNLVVTLESEQTLINTLKDQGIDLLSDDYLEDEANDILNTEDPNGLRRWENLVTGTSTNQLQLGQVDATDDTTVTIGLLPGEKTPVVLGYTVLYDLRRWKDDSKTWRRVAGPAATSDFPIQLVDAEGKSVNAAGYYRVFTLIVPNNLQTITNEIPAKNIIGVLEVNSAIRSTMTAVPWYALPSDPKAPGNITPMKYVSKGQLSSGDSIYSMNSDGTYEMWTLEENTSGQTSEIGGYDWAPGTTVRASASGNVRLASATSPGEAGLERGSAVWVEREVRTKPYFLVGQYCGTSVDVSVKEGSGNTPGFTMIANHNLVPLGLNEIDWGGNPTADDMIQIPTDTRVPITLRWTKDKSGQYKWGQVMVNPANGRSSWKFDYTIPAGVGVWYIRRGGAFNVTVPSRHPNFAE